MPADEFQNLLRFFKVLADENRLKLLGMLAIREHSVEELALLLHLRAPTISHHLTRLKELELVQMRSHGNTHLYRLAADHLHSISKGLLSSEIMAALVPAAEPEGDAWERKVLRDFFQGPRLKEIPASRKKRSVVLRWLASQFEPGTSYTEAQINEVIQRHHPDASALRREMVGERLLQREQGIYQRMMPVD
jgi:DNA-binding transcriptional ArsR family regulator